MTKAINRLAESFHRAPMPSPYTLHHPFAFPVCSTAINFAAPTPFSFPFSRRIDPSLSLSVQFYAFLRDATALFSRVFPLLLARRTLPLPAFLFLSPLTNPPKQQLIVVDAIAVNRLRLWLTNASGPIGSLLFGD